MKKAYCLLVMLVLLSACSSKKLDDRVVPLVEKNCGKPIETHIYEIQHVYLFAVPMSEAGEKTGKTKNAIDKKLNLLPTERTLENHLYSTQYRWETPQYRVVLTKYVDSADGPYYVLLELMDK